MLRPIEFVSVLRDLHFADTFNPYADHCPVYDKHDAPSRRASMLLAMLETACKKEIDSIWIGRDLGYRGGRRTGMALTDDLHMELHAQRWGLAMYRPTKGQVVAERTAAVIWSVLDRIEAPIFLWNVFPLHPHEPDEPFSNRSHNARERSAGEEILAALIELLEPKRIVAIGGDAARSMARISPNTQVTVVRHPSYGGQTEFVSQVSKLYRLRSHSLL